MNLLEIIKMLSRLPGPPGLQEQVHRETAELIKDYVDEVHFDNAGNLIAVRKSGSALARRLMLYVCTDEPGFIITGVENGFLKFSVRGDTDERYLPASDVKILAADPLFGVICARAPHTLFLGDADKPLPADELYIDVGLSQEEAEKRVPLGTAAVFSAGCEGRDGEKICGKALSCRVGAAVLIKALEYVSGDDLPVDIYAVFGSREGSGTGGAGPAAFSVEPDYALVIDATHAHLPGASKIPAVRSGKGPAAATGPCVSRGITDRLTDLAREKKIPFQIEVVPGAGNPTVRAVQTSGAGVPTVLILLPVRYVNSPAEVADLKDAEAAVSLIGEFIKDPEEEF
ncbi:MAG: hypothetical protein FWG32_02070 [Oscillospiraceae bacterium]|nr:hypothetical protein [Oscillospiraceae bacterium]